MQVKVFYHSFIIYQLISYVCENACVCVCLHVWVYVFERERELLRVYGDEKKTVGFHFLPAMWDPGI